jgi:type IV pilus assembly protein PilO
MKGKNSLVLLTTGMAAIILGMPVASYFLIFRPQNAELKKTNEQVSHLQDVLSKLREETSKNEDLVRANDEMKSAIKGIEERLPTNQEIDQIVRQVSERAVQAGLQPPAIRASRPKQAGLYMEQPLDMEVLGGFDGFVNFLTAVEQMPRLTRIHDMKIADRSTDEDEVRITFTLSIYFLENSGQTALADFE